MPVNLRFFCRLVQVEVNGERLQDSLSPEERDELLQYLLIAASVGGKTVFQRLEECLLGAPAHAASAAALREHTPEELRTWPAKGEPRRMTGTTMDASPVR